MNSDRLQSLSRTYRDGLLSDTLAFWTRHAVDREQGGFMFCVDRDGTVVDTDKGMWQQCRFTWLLATLYRTVEPRPEWLELARHGIAFIREHGFDTDGRMFFQVTRDGRPLRKRRYVFTELFGVAALAAYGVAANDEAASDQARELYALAMRHLHTPGLLAPKVHQDTRPMKSMSVPMMTIVTSRIMRDLFDDPSYDDPIEASIEEIRRDFVKPEHEAVMEVVAPDGGVYDHFDGRMLNPGHAIEAAWFILHEAKLRDGDASLIDLGTTILDWMWQRGWDTEYGGLFSFRDLHNRPVQEYWHDMKFWWPHNETIIATLLAYHLTGDLKYAQWHEQVHEWAHKHFADPEHGEWFGYLHRDGRLSVTLKGNLWKGPFHLPRMQWYCWKLTEEMLAGQGQAANASAPQA